MRGRCSRVPGRLCSGGSRAKASPPKKILKEIPSQFAGGVPRRGEKRERDGYTAIEEGAGARERERERGRGQRTERERERGIERERETENKRTRERGCGVATRARTVCQSGLYFM